MILDDGVYVNCKFKNCSLEYSGGDVYVQNCQGEGCQLVWRGAAKRRILASVPGGSFCLVTEGSRMSDHMPCGTVGHALSRSP